MKLKLLITTITIVATLLIINLLSNELHFRLDFTEDSQYTLSKATIDILKGLDEPVTVKAYFTKGLPANIEKSQKDFQELLVEYSNRSGGMLSYEFINPNENEALTKQAIDNGIRGVMVKVREKDQVKEQKAFLGALVTLGDKRDVIPFVQPGMAMEFSLTTAIKKVSVVNKTKVGFLQGHGEPPISEMVQAQGQLSVQYDISEINIDSLEIPKDIQTLAIIRPTDTIPDAHLQKLDNFLSSGGNLFVAINRVDGKLQEGYGVALNTQLESWLEKKGLRVEPAFLADSKCGAVTVQTQEGMFSFQTQISFPFLPVINKFAKHPITQGLESMFFEFTSPIVFLGDTSLRYTPIVFSSDKANAFPAPLQFDVNKRWTDADFTQKDLAIAGVMEGKFGGDKESKLVVIGDGNLVVNGEGQQQRQQQPDNINFFANSIDWISDDTGLIELRTKGATSRPIKELSDTTRLMLKYLNFLLPILLVLGYGIIRLQRNKIKRFKRMSENYEAN